MYPLIEGVFASFAQESFFSDLGAWFTLVDLEDGTGSFVDVGFRMFFEGAL